MLISTVVSTTALGAKKYTVVTDNQPQSVRFFLRHGCRVWSCQRVVRTVRVEEENTPKRIFRQVLLAFGWVCVFTVLYFRVVHFSSLKIGPLGMDVIWKR